MKKSKCKRWIVIALVITLVLQSSAVVFAVDNKNDDLDSRLEISFTPSENVNIEELPEDEVIAIIEGITICAKDISENGTVIQEKSEFIQDILDSGTQCDGEISMLAFVDDCKKVVAAKYQNKMILVEGKTIAPQFSQSEKHTYLPNRRILKFTEALESGIANDVAVLLAGFIPQIGAGVSIGIFLVNGVKKENTRNLRNLRDSGKAAQYSVYKSSYGVTSFVATWDKKTIKGKNATDSAANSKYVVSNIFYEN